MDSTNHQIKIKIEDHFLSEEDLDDLRRWEDEGGSPSKKMNLLDYPSLPVHKKEIFEIVDSDIISEDGQLYILAEINVLSHH